MNPKIFLASVVLVLGVTMCQGARMFILDDEDFEQHIRVRRDTPLGLVPQPLREYSPIPPVANDRDLDVGSSDYHKSSHGYGKGKVGPVYTFVKTDPYAHFKWGVRHVAGKKYAHGH